MQEVTAVPLTARTLARRVTASRSLPWLAGIAGLFLVAQLLVVIPGSGLGWDETVYVSQVDPHVPTAFFSAPRARGISYLVAPVTALTSSTLALRLYLALSSSAGLLLALSAWRRLLPPPVLAAAGALFGSLWVTLYYGPEAMPNLWDALAALAAVGCFLRAARDSSDRGALAGLGVAVVVVALMRPPDAFYLVLPMVVTALLVAGHRRPAVLVVLVAALVVGCAPWIIDAQLHYGGVAARIRRAGEIQGKLGAHLAIDDQLRSLQGSVLCRPCTMSWTRPVTGAWWFALPLLTAGGVAAAIRAHRTAVLLLPTAAAASTAFPYLFLIDYAAPRFLLPAYALIALPVAECLRALLAATRPQWRLTTAALIGCALAAHVAVQYAVLTRVVARSQATRQHNTAIADRLHHRGVRPPCVVTGHGAPPAAYYAGCASRQVGGHDASISPAGLLKVSRSRPVAVLVAPGANPPAYARTWRFMPLTASHGDAGPRAFLAPRRGRWSSG